MVHQSPKESLIAFARRLGRVEMDALNSIKEDYERKKFGTALRTAFKCGLFDESDLEELSEAK